MHLYMDLHQHDMSWNNGFSIWDVNSGWFLALEPVECGVKYAFIKSNWSVESCGQFWTGEILVLQNCCTVFSSSTQDAVGHQESFLN